MNNSKKIVLAVAMLCSAGTALAQEVINPSWYVQPHAVYVQVDDDLLDEKDWGGGLKFGKPISPMWDIQIGASYMEAKTREGPLGNTAKYKQTLLGVDALWMLSRKNFRPYILFGVGASDDKIEGPRRDASETNPYATAGIGFQWAFSPQWSMQADLRSVQVFVDEDKFGSDRVNNQYLTIGINYAFSRPAPPPPPPPPVEVVVQPPPPPPPPPPPARFEKVTMSATELFPFNSASLTSPQPKLDEIAAALAADPSITDVDVTGYADRLGSAKYNQKLSERRANAVRDYLVAKGIAPGRIKAYGRGEANPVVTCTNKKKADLIKCLEPNRRVEVEQITVERRVQ